MNIRSFLPWGFTAGRNAVAEKKAAPGFLSLAAQGQASWTGRSYAALSREGFMKNPVAHRCVRLVAEAAACVPFLIYEGERERPEHPAAALLRQPNGRMGGPDFFEALYGHLLLSGNAYVEPLMVGAALRLVAITVVNSPHYDGAFDMAGASIKAGFHAPETYPFYFDEYPGYSHGKTVDETESAVENEDAFVTFVFRPKK